MTACDTLFTEMNIHMKQIDLHQTMYIHIFLSMTLHREKLTYDAGGRLLLFTVYS